MRWWIVCAWVIAAAGAVMVAVAVANPIVAADPSPSTGPDVPRSQVHEPYPVDSFGQIVVARDLFRAERRPARIPYDLIRAGLPVALPVPKPLLILTGIAWGREPSAVLEGFPGIEGSRTVRQGDVVAGLALKNIERDRVIVVGMDTTWTLTVREPWKP